MKIKAKSHNRLKNNLRWEILQIVDKIVNQGEYSNVLIDRFLQESTFEERDNRLLVQIVYGVIQYLYTLDYYLEPLLQGKKVEEWVRNLLRLSLYQLIYLDRVPAHAVLNEAVQIAKINGHQALGNFVNAILRKFLRQERRAFKDIGDNHKRLATQYSVAPWIVDEFMALLGEERCEKVLASLQTLPYISARINPQKADREAIMAALSQEGLKVSASELSPYGIRILAGNILHSPQFAQGYLTLQDESSMLVAPLGQLTGEEEVLDACAAPGGKATHIASLLTKGHLTALDISANKLRKVDQHLERMGLSKLVTTIVADASKFQTKGSRLYDIIYLDAPCSGLGLLRRKPEIKYTKSPQDITNLVAIQRELLAQMAQLVKVGGHLIYSTCTLTKAENEEQLRWFLEEFPTFHTSPILPSEGVPEQVITPEGNIRIYPDDFHSDGFFISRLTKKDN